jgi:hypothetical protein
MDEIEPFFREVQKTRSAYDESQTRSAENEKCRKREVLFVLCRLSFVFCLLSFVLCVFFCLSSFCLLSFVFVLGRDKNTRSLCPFLSLLSFCHFCHFVILSFCHFVFCLICCLSHKDETTYENSFPFVFFLSICLLVFVFYL